MRKHVGDGELLEEAVPQPQEALAHAVRIGVPRGKELARQLVVAADGPLDDLREPRGKEQEPQVALLGRVLGVVGVNQVADALERVERDAQRKQDAQAGGGVCCAKVEEQHVEVLKEAQDDERQHEGDPKRVPALLVVALLERLALGAVLGGLARGLGLVVKPREPTCPCPNVGRGQKQQKERLPAAGKDVKRKACGKQHVPLRLGPRAAERVVRGKCHHQQQHKL